MVRIIVEKVVWMSVAALLGLAVYLCSLMTYRPQEWPDRFKFDHPAIYGPTPEEIIISNGLRLEDCIE